MHMFCCVSGLQAELQAAQKESEATRQKIRHLESELAEFRQKNQELQEQVGQKNGKILHFMHLAWAACTFMHSRFPLQLRESGHSENSRTRKCR